MLRELAARIPSGLERLHGWAERAKEGVDRLRDEAREDPIGFGHRGLAERRAWTEWWPWERGEPAADVLGRARPIPQRREAERGGGLRVQTIRRMSLDDLRLHDPNTLSREAMEAAANRWDELAGARR